MSIVVNLPPAEEANPIEEMRRRIREWQEKDHTPTMPRLASQPGLTPTAALFAQWAEEDADKTDEEIAANDQLWQDFREGINDERRQAHSARRRS